MSLLAKKVALLEQRRGEVASLEKEIAGMLNLPGLPRPYLRRNPLLNKTDEDEEPEPEKKTRRVPANKLSEDAKQEILERLKGDEFIADICVALGRSSSTVTRVAKEAGINLRKRGRRIMRLSETGTAAPAVKPAPAPAPAPAPEPQEPLTKKILELRRQEKTQTEIARAIHRSADFVRAVLKAHGMNGLITDAQRVLAFKLKSEGKTHSVICQEIGIGTTALTRLLKGPNPAR